MTTNDLNIRQKLQTKIVGIAGCGGLGSNCAVALARVGIGKLVIADFDRVEESNLNRQYFFADQVGMFKVNALRDNIHRVDKNIEVDPQELFLDETNIPEVFAECDVIVEAFDKAEMKQVIIETVTDKMPGKALICGVGLAGWGRNELIGMKTYDHIYICGDMTSEVDENNPPLAPRVGMVANMQANQVLEILLGKMQ